VPASAKRYVAGLVEGALLQLFNQHLEHCSASALQLAHGIVVPFLNRLLNASNIGRSNCPILDRRVVAIEALYALVGFCIGAGLVGSILTLWHFKTMEKLFKLSNLYKLDSAVNVGQDVEDRSKCTNEVFKVYKLNEEVNVEQHNIKQPSKSSNSEVLKAEILRLRSQGLSMREIAKKLGCSRSLVAYYLKKMC